MKLVFISYHNIGNEGREAEKQDLGRGRECHELSRVVGKLIPSFMWLTAVGHNHFSMFGPNI